MTFSPNCISCIGETLVNTYHWWWNGTYLWRRKNSGNVQRFLPTTSWNKSQPNYACLCLWFVDWSTEAL